MEGGRRKSWTVSEGWEFGGGRLGVPVMISGKCQEGLFGSRNPLS